MYREIETVLSVPEKDAEWHRKRRRTVNASEVGAILGVSKYRSPWNVWAEKCDKVEPFEGNEKTLWGTIHEKTIIAEVERRTGYECKESQEPMEHRDHDWFCCTIDAKIYDNPKNACGYVPMEIKTADIRLLQMWEDEGIPLDYQAQCNAQMAIWECSYMYLAVLFGGNTLKLYKIERDDDLIEMVIEKCSFFYHNHMMTGDAPEVGELDVNAVATMHPTSKDLDPAELTEKLVEDLAEADREMKKWKKVFDDRKAKIQSELEENETGMAGKYKVTWKTTTPRTAVDTKKLRVEFPQVFATVAKVGAPSRRFTYREV